MISVKDVKKDYKDGDTVVNALRGVSLDIAGGEFISIAGPSGSGKTTLLNLIGCIDTIDGGDIAIESESLKDKTKKELSAIRRAKLGFVFQNFNLIPVLTAYENVALALSIQGLEDGEINGRVMKILEEVGLNGMEDRRPAKLSGGQQQRVAVARALIKEPAIVLADEPTANLDSETGRSVLDLMKELNKKMGTTFIFSTHDKMVMDFADQLVMLHDGTIQSDTGSKRRK